MYHETAWGQSLVWLFGGFESALRVHVYVGIFMLAAFLARLVYLLVMIILGGTGFLLAFPLLSTQYIPGSMATNTAPSLWRTCDCPVTTPKSALRTHCFLLIEYQPWLSRKKNDNRRTESLCCLRTFLF